MDRLGGMLSRPAVFRCERSVIGAKQRMLPMPFSFVEKGSKE